MPNPNECNINPGTTTIHLHPCPRCNSRSVYQSKSTFDVGNPGSGKILEYRRCILCGNEFDLREKLEKGPEPKHCEENCPGNMGPVQDGPVGSLVSLRWSSERPFVDGYYFSRVNSKDNSPEVVRVNNSAIFANGEWQNTVYVTGEEEPYLHEDFVKERGGEWYGPLSLEVI